MGDWRQRPVHVLVDVVGGARSKRADLRRGLSPTGGHRSLQGPAGRASLQGHRTPPSVPAPRVPGGLGGGLHRRPGHSLDGHRRGPLLHDAAGAWLLPDRQLGVRAAGRAPGGYLRAGLAAGDEAVPPHHAGRPPGGYHGGIDMADPRYALLRAPTLLRRRWARGRPGHAHQGVTRAVHRGAAADHPPARRMEKLARRRGFRRRGAGGGGALVSQRLLADQEHQYRGGHRGHRQYKRDRPTALLQREPPVVPVELHGHAAVPAAVHLRLRGLGVGAYRVRAPALGQPARPRVGWSGRSWRGWR